MHTLSTWALLHFWHRPLLVSSTCLTCSWAAHWASCHCCTDTFSLTHFSTSLASSTSPYQILHSTSLPCFWDMHPHSSCLPEANYYDMEPRNCVEMKRLFSVRILSCSFKGAWASLYFSHKPAALSTSLYLGIHVKKCWFLLESTREKQLRKAIRSSHIRIWSTPLLQHAEETAFFASGIGKGEG